MKYTVIIPTMWLHPVLLETMVIKYNHHPLIEEILLVDNNRERRMNLDFLKVRVIGSGKNMFVNPAWNLAVKEAKTEGVIIANDDILIGELDDAMMVIDQALRPGAVIFPHKTCFKEFQKHPIGQPRIEPGDTPSYGFGTFMAVRRDTYQIIPEGLQVWYGDHLQWDFTEPLFLKGVNIETDMRGTSRTLNLAGVSNREKQYYFKWKSLHTPQTYASPVSHKGSVMVVLKNGGDFTFRDVLLIADRIRDHNGVSVQVKCMLDKAEKVWELGRVQLRPMVNNRWKGWWSKMNLFAPELEDQRPFLYLDLDTAVVGDLDAVLPPKGHEHEFITLEDFYHKNRLATGMMWIPAGSEKVQQIWNEWIKDPRGHMHRHRGDQEFIRSVTGADRFWQEITTTISSYKPRSGHLKVLPKDISVVCFHGKPRIWEAAKTVEWVYKYVQND